MNSGPVPQLGYRSRLETWVTRGWRAWSALLVGVGLLTLVVLFTPFANVLSYPLVLGESLAPADVIVVLGGGTTSDGSLSEISLRRVWYGVRLFKRGYAPLLLFSTGVTDLGSVSEAKRMAEAALDMGVPSSSILLEERSKRTVQNAVEVARILRSIQAEAALLVTHPTHMPRAVAAFRRAGIAVLPAPTDGNEDHATDPMGRGMLFLKVGYEYAAWVMYWWRGWV